MEALVDLSTQQVSLIEVAFAELAAAPATHRRSIAPTAASKLLFAVRPTTITAWDARISRRPGIEGSFAAHLADAQDLGRSWAREAGHEEVADLVDRPRSSLAKIVDEVLYLTWTRHRS